MAFDKLMLGKKAKKKAAGGAKKAHGKHNHKKNHKHKKAAKSKDRHSAGPGRDPSAQARVRTDPAPRTGPPSAQGATATP